MTCLSSFRLLFVLFARRDQLLIYHDALLYNDLRKPSRTPRDGVFVRGSAESYLRFINDIQFRSP